MINVNDTIQSAYKGDAFKGNVTFTIDSTQYTAHNILANSTTITESIASGEDIDFRAVEKSCLEITLINITEDIKDLKGKTLTMKQTVLNTDIPLGVYTIDTAVNDGDYLYDITAYDNLYKFDKDVSDWWNTQVTFPITLRNLLISLCTYVGVSYNFPETFTNSDFLVEQNIYVENVTGIEFLGYIQEACAGFIKADRTGAMKLVQLIYDSANGLYPDTTLYPDTDLYPVSDHDISTATPNVEYTVPLTIDTLQIADYETDPILSVQIRHTQDDIGIVAGSGANSYVIEANPLFYSFTGSSADIEVAQNILDILTEITYVPVTTRVKAQPYIEVGDLVKFTSYEGKQATAPLLHRVMSGFLLTSDSITIKGTADRTVTVNTPINKTVKILNQRLHEIVNTVDTFDSRIVSVETDIADVSTQMITSTELKQTADDIQFTVNKKLEGYVTEEDLGTQLQLNADNIIARVWSSGEGKETKEAIADLSTEGLTVTTTGDSSSSRLNGSGLLILKLVGVVDGRNKYAVVAKFTQEESYTNNLTVGTYLRFGAHRWEAIAGKEYDGVTTIGTAAAWTGPQEELFEILGDE